VNQATGITKPKVTVLMKEKLQHGISRFVTYNCECEIFIAIGQTQGKSKA